jgi:hypothetical protein
MTYQHADYNVKYINNPSKLATKHNEILDNLIFRIDQIKQWCTLVLLASEANLTPHIYIYKFRPENYFAPARSFQNLHKLLRNCLTAENRNKKEAAKCPRNKKSH